MKITTHKEPNKIIVLQGVPASGKSTWARNIVKDTKDFVIVSRDAIRESRGDYWVPEQENYISKVEEFQVRSAVESGLNVIIDATNLNPKTIAKWEKIAVETESILEYKLFKIGYKEALERDKNRPRPVGTKVLKQFFRNYFPEDLYKETGEIDARIILEPDSKLPKCILCDIDGTVALRTGRSAFDYSKVNEDKVDPRMQQLFEKLLLDPDVHLIFFSGREGTQDCINKTKQWLLDNFNYGFKLYMRIAGDHRKDSIVKRELYEEHIKDKYNVLAVFDDRNQVVDMWRELGLLCLQVYYGDF